MYECQNKEYIKTNKKCNQNVIERKRKIKVNGKEILVYTKNKIVRNQIEEEKSIEKTNIKGDSHLYKNINNKEDNKFINNVIKNNKKIEKKADCIGSIADNYNYFSNNNFNKNEIKQINFGMNPKEFKRLRSHEILKNKNINNNIAIDKRRLINNSKPKSRLHHTQQIITLKNVSEITYMSSCLYCLINIGYIKDYFIKNLEIIQKKGSKMPICYYFSRIIYHFFINNNSDDNKYSINNFYSQIMTQNPIFMAKMMGKSISFLIYLLEKIDDEDKQLAKSNISEIFHKFFLIQRVSCLLPIFAWVNRKVKICWECGKIFKTFQKFFTYDIDIELILNKIMVNEQKNELSILDCINYLSERATLFNIYCRNCHQKTNFMKDSHIFLTQKVFIVLLKEMENKEYINRIKNEKIKIKINESLDLSNIVKYKSNYAMLRYNIHGMVMFDSEKLEYIAYTINQIDGKWYKYIKENAFQAELKDFINIYDFKTFPVILFYKKE